MKIAVLFDEVPESGGGYQQAYNELISIDTAKLDPRYTFIFATTKKRNLPLLRALSDQAYLLPLNLLDKAAIYLRRAVIEARLYRLIYRLFGLNKFEKELNRLGVDLVYFLSPSSLAQDLDFINFVYTVWDLCHRDHFEFPEVRGLREFELREISLQRIVPKAVAVFVDSEHTRLKVVEGYNVDPDRVSVRPFIPSKNLVSEKFLDQDCEMFSASPFLVYPAQFWSHKNHRRIVEAVRILKHEVDFDVQVIFTGADKGNRHFIESLVDMYDLKDRIRFEGFVTYEELRALITNASALIMPTYFGPLNLPPLEAYTLETPVLYSDLSGFSGAVGNAAIPISVSDSSALANKIKAIIEDEDLRVESIQRGLKALQAFSDFDRNAQLAKVLIRFNSKLECWRDP